MNGRILYESKNVVMYIWEAGLEDILKAIRDEELNVPRHVAIIMDGNGRWAKKRNLPRKYGHKKGANTVEQIIEDGYNMGIEYITVYAFSTENWMCLFQ